MVLERLGTNSEISYVKMLLQNVLLLECLVCSDSTISRAQSVDLFLLLFIILHVREDINKF
jgi:hypothetical protein